MPQPTDEKLYEKIKNELFKKYKPSAYRSGLLVQRYKEEYVKKHNNKNYYRGNKTNSNLKRWCINSRFIPKFRFVFLMSFYI